MSNVSEDGDTPFRRRVRRELRLETRSFRLEAEDVATWHVVFSGKLPVYIYKETDINVHTHAFSLPFFFFF